MKLNVLYEIKRIGIFAIIDRTNTELDFYPDTNEFHYLFNPKNNVSIYLAKSNNFFKKENYTILEADEEQKELIKLALLKAKDYKFNNFSIVRDVSSFIKIISSRHNDLLIDFFKSEIKKIPLADVINDDRDIIYFFRGHANYKWDLKPSVLREKSDGTQYNENKLVSTFQKYNKDELKNFEMPEQLAIMQHYGLPTRLLDITRNPLVALYMSCISNFDEFGEVITFYDIKHSVKSMDDRIIKLLSCAALLSNDDKKCINDCITMTPNPTIKNINKNDKIDDKSKIKFSYVISKYEEIVKKNSNIEFINEDEDLYELTYSYFLDVGFINKRLKAQDGLFILNGLDNDSNNERLFTSKSTFNKIFVLNKNKILEELSAIGINEYKLFDDMEHCSKHIKKLDEDGLL